MTATCRNQRSKGIVLDSIRCIESKRPISRRDDPAALFFLTSLFYVLENKEVGLSISPRNQARKAMVLVSTCVSFLRKPSF